MKRYLMPILLVPIVFLAFGVTIAAGTSGTQSTAKKSAKKTTKKKAGGGKVAIKCPAAITESGGSIADCPNTGCGPSLDPELNKQKNIASNDDTPVDSDMASLAALPDPVPGFQIGDTREKLRALGEGKMIRVVALALVARKGSRESCNCGLSKAADTDNHIVLVDPETEEPALKENEPDSQTAEFTPRVRLTHPGLKGAELEKLITAAADKALLVRVTGVQMFDSEHSLGPLHLKRHNNWEIHPIFKLEYCPEEKTCVEDSDANWVDLEK
jgi:hypothetical protein